MKPIIRCSSLGSLLVCHGSGTLVPMVAPREGNENFEGSTLHHRTAKTLVEHMGALASEGLPDWPDGVARDYVLPRSSEWLHNFFVVHAKETIPDEWSLQVEVALKWEFPRFVLLGHHDVLAVSPDGAKSHGIDWKAVYRAVPEAAQNSQVLGYLVLTYKNYLVRAASFDIVQPRISSDDGERISSVTLNAEQLKQAAEYLEREVNAALDDPMTVNSGLSQCAWCPAALQCPAIAAELEYMKATLTQEFLDQVSAVPDDKKLADLVVSARTLRRPIEDAEEMIRERLEHVGRINGTALSVTMEKRKGRFSVTEGEEKSMYDAVHELLPVEEVAGCVSYSTDSLKQAIARVRNVPQSGKNPNSAEKVFQRDLGPHLTQGESRVLRFRLDL